MIKILRALCYLIVSVHVFSNAHADDSGLHLVLNNLSKISSVQADFLETKTSSMLDKSIELSGALEYFYPNTIIKKTLNPSAALFKVTDNNLHITNTAGEKYELLLSNHPVIEVFVEAYRGVLSGDFNKLKTFYDIYFTKNKSYWTIKLTPLDDEALEYIDLITIEGKGVNINKVITLESGGDKSIMKIVTK